MGDRAGALEEERVAGTGMWFLEDKTFVAWMKSESPPVLWLSGIGMPLTAESNIKRAPGSPSLR